MKHHLPGELLIAVFTARDIRRSTASNEIPAY